MADNNYDEYFDEQEGEVYPNKEYDKNSTSTSNSTTTSSGSSESQSNTVRRNHADIVEAPTQESVETKRIENPSAYLDALGAGQKPLADPLVQQRTARRQMIANGLFDLASAMVRGGVSDAQGVTGHIDKDASNPYYLQSFKNYSSAIPDYNKAIAKQNAELVKQQGALQKALMQDESKVNLQNGEYQNKARYGNAKNQLTAAIANSRNNSWSESGTDTSKSYQGNQNNTTTRNTNESGHVMASKPQSNGRGGKLSDDATLPSVSYPIMDKDGVTRQKALLKMNVGDFKQLLSDIKVLADDTSDKNTMRFEGYGGLTRNPKERKAIIDNAKYIQNLLQEHYYNKYGKNINDGATTVSGEKNYNLATLPDEQLIQLWRETAPAFVKSDYMLGPLRHHLSNMIVLDADSNQKMNGLKFLDYLGTRAQRFQNVVPKATE